MQKSFFSSFSSLSNEPSVRCSYQGQELSQTDSFMEFPVIAFGNIAGHYTNRVRCINKGSWRYSCVSTKCNQPAIICRNKLCKCRTLHSQCAKMKAKIILENTERRFADIGNNDSNEWVISVRQHLTIFKRLIQELEQKLKSACISKAGNEFMQILKERPQQLSKLTAKEMSKIAGQFSQNKESMVQVRDIESEKAVIQFWQQEHFQSVQKELLNIDSAIKKGGKTDDQHNSDVPFIEELVSKIISAISQARPQSSLQDLNFTQPEHKSYKKSKRLTKEGRLRQSEGKFNQSNQCLKKALQIRLELFPSPYCREIISLIRAIAWNLYECRQYQQSIDLHKLCFLIQKSSSTLQASEQLLRQIGDTCYGLGVVYQTARRFQQSFEVLSRSLAIREELASKKVQINDANSHVDPQQDLNIAITLQTQANTLKQLGQFNLAHQKYKRTLSIYEDIAKGQPTIEMSKTWHNIASCYQQQRRYSAAIENYSKSLAIKRKLLRPDHKSILLTLTNMAALYLQNQNYDLALETATQSQSLVSQIERLNSLTYAKNAITLSIIHSKRQQPHKSIFYISQAYSIYKAVYGDADQRTQHILDQLKRIKRQIGFQASCSQNSTRGSEIQNNFQKQKIRKGSRLLT